MGDDIGGVDVGRVLTLARAAGLPTQAAEDLAVDVAHRYRQHDGPGWLQRASPQTRLDVLTVLAVLRSNDG